MTPKLVPLLPVVFLDVQNYAPPEFTHLSTEFNKECDVAQGRTGTSMWTSRNLGAQVVIAWDWIVVNHGAVAVRDPMQIITNLRFATGERRAASQSTAAIHFAQMIRALRWQPYALTAIRAHRQACALAGQVVPRRSWAAPPQTSIESEVVARAA